MTDAIEILEAEPQYWLPPSARQPVVRAITADGIPVKPPAAWFEDPRLDHPTPLTITADGHIFGHVATWSTSHIGLPGGVKPPRSRSNYAFFATGALETDAGHLVDVGQITLVGGHAPLDASLPQAVAHYDNTDSAIADVAVGEDLHGIWASGALRPSVTDEQIRIMRASAVSGDWRPINGHLEMVAVCSVNVPGFPIPKARVASGQILAMVAAGVEPLVAERLRELGGSDMVTVAAVDALSDRVRLIEDTLYMISEDAEECTDCGGDELTASIEALRQRVRGIDGVVATVAASADPVEALRSRVHG